MAAFERIVSGIPDMDRHWIISGWGIMWSGEFQISRNSGISANLI